MSIGLVGTKIGMSRFFTEDGLSIPVTLVYATPNRISQIKTIEQDNYSAIQITTGTKKTSRLSKPMIGHFAKAKIDAGNYNCEFRLDDITKNDYKVGAVIDIDIFSKGQKVDVRGVSKGKGFAGVVKRHNFQMQDATHGNSLSHRAPGSIGQCQEPGRVFKGKKMAGHMGHENCTTQNLEIISVDKSKNLIAIKGAIPGAKSSHVIIKPSVKSQFVSPTTDKKET
ncbi:MAG: 50S ribosomal protein L3 [Gammaproteobacteria bacterium]|nr:MAG: 50S ribosomal protein L3 [Gammaproteobacteria bacterium]